MTEGDLLDQQWNVDFGVAKSMRYHAYRRSFWETTDYWTKIVTVVSGTAVLVSIIGETNKDHPLAMWFAFIVAVFSAADVVLGFSDRARIHDHLYRRFCLLGQEIAKVVHPNESQISEWRRHRLEIEMDEPGTLDWLERRCAAEESKARGVPPRPSWILPMWKILLSQFAFWPSITRVEG